MEAGRGRVGALRWRRRCDGALLATLIQRHAAAGTCSFPYLLSSIIHNRFSFCCIGPMGAGRMRKCHACSFIVNATCMQVNLGWMMVVLIPALAVAWWSMLMSPALERLLSVSPL